MKLVCFQKRMFFFCIQQDEFSIIADVESGLYDGDDYPSAIAKAAALIRKNFVNLQVTFRNLHVEYKVDRPAVSLEGYAGMGVQKNHIT